MKELLSRNWAHAPGPYPTTVLTFAPSPANVSSAMRDMSSTKLKTASFPSPITALLMMEKGNACFATQTIFSPIKVFVHVRKHAPSPSTARTMTNEGFVFHARKGTSSMLTDAISHSPPTAK